jgi:hypothetical protein
MIKLKESVGTALWKFVYLVKLQKTLLIFQGKAVLLNIFILLIKWPMFCHECHAFFNVYDIENC